MIHFRKISSALLTVVFLISASGFSVTRHLCLESGRVEFTLSEDYLCSGNTGEDCCAEETTCCPDTDVESIEKEISNEKCCVEKTSYFKTDNVYAAPERTEIPYTGMQIASGFQSVELFPEFEQTFERKAHKLPRINSSREYLIPHCILLI